MRKQSGLGLIGFYLCIIVVISYVACYFAYQQQRGELLADMEMTLLRVTNEYESITDDFWNIYIPIYENKNSGQAVLYQYFSRTDLKELQPLEKMELKNVLRLMAMRDDRVRWVAVVNQERETNYIYQVETDAIQPLEEEFPYWNALAEKSNVLEMYGEEPYTKVYNTIVMAGGGLRSNVQDAILVGYDTSQLHRICESNRILPSIQFDIAVDGKSIFSSGTRELLMEDDFLPGESGICRKAGGRYYVSVSAQTIRGARIYFSVDNKELSSLSHRNTPLILFVVLGVVIFSFVQYGLRVHMINQEIGILRTGLEKIGENMLEYRIHAEFRQSDFKIIADAINEMAQQLKENIDRVYYYKIRQRESEMQELQAKFNPHFLYNSLEMFRARCYQNGDEETAELIAQTAAIFRGFINPNTFILIQDELAFSKRYLMLFRARYGDTVEILYDFDTEVLQYGIVRNAFQPLVENYFVHGFNTACENNYIRFSGKIRDENAILITVEDNGLGMSQEEMEILNKSLQEPVVTEKESYGLKNLNQRLALFYGREYGITLHGNAAGGLTIEMLIRRWTCKEVENREKGI